VSSDTIAGVRSAIFSALAEGATAITPNRRLARHLRRGFDRAQHAAGKRSWPTPSILPYGAWLEALWEQGIAAGMEAGARLLLSPTQSALLWRSVISAHGPVLLDPAGAARVAEEAWSITCAWGAGGESWRGWRRSDGGDADDPGTFAAWAEAFLAELRRAQAIDLPQLGDVLARNAALLAARVPRVVLAGFISLSPQQQRLIDALNATGAGIRTVDAPAPHPSNASRTTAATRRDEVCAALEWARARALAEPACSVGIVIEDLAQRREEIIALAEDVLCPGLILPPDAAARRPFEVSLGTPLAMVPVVVAALDLIALREVGLERNAAAAMLRSPYLAGDETAWGRRAGIERQWLVGGRRHITLDDAIAALERVSPDCAERWRRARSGGHGTRRASPREWVDRWRTWLEATGWPGTRPLDSAEHQAREAWEGLLTEFARLGSVASRLDRDNAIETLRLLARDRVFQPEGTVASVQLLGILEGSGLDFDALWVAGLSADRWPRAPSPNPLLPIHWQRERNIPRASAAGELDYARTITARFAAAAPVVMFSSAESADDHRLLPSTLLLDYPLLASPPLSKPWAHTIAESVSAESVEDARAPVVQAGSHLRGGAAIIAAQSDCPFQAVARHRLSVKPWPVAPAGLTPEERGGLAHGALKAFWDAIRDKASLSALDRNALAARIDAAVGRSIAQLPLARRQSLPASVYGEEQGRLTAVLRKWIELEHGRPGFAVADTERQTTLALGPVRLSLRLDRIDTLEEGGGVIIDYKTGRAMPPRQWFEERPQAPQLGLYALAQRAASPDLPLRALVYAQLRADQVEAVGIAADASAWPGLTELPALKRFPDWPALEAWWEARLGALAAEIAAGCASVSPRFYPSTCRTCGVQALCRIESARVKGGDDADD